MVNEVLSKVWRKLNTFLRSEARNLESSRQKPVDFFWKSVFARPLRHGAITVYYLTSLLSWFFLSFLRVHTAMGQVFTGRHGRWKRPRMALVSLQGPREGWSGQHRRGSRKGGPAWYSPALLSQQVELWGESVLNFWWAASQWMAGHQPPGSEMLDA